MTELTSITLDELKRDGVTAEIIGRLSEEDRTVLIIEYAKSAMKRYNKFQECLNISKLAREAFNLKVLSII